MVVVIMVMVMMVVVAFLFYDSEQIKESGSVISIAYCLGTLEYIQ